MTSNQTGTDEENHTLEGFSRYFNRRNSPVCGKLNIRWDDARLSFFLFFFFVLWSDRFCTEHKHGSFVCVDRLGKLKNDLRLMVTWTIDWLTDPLDQWTSFDWWNITSRSRLCRTFLTFISAKFFPFFSHLLALWFVGLQGFEAKVTMDTINTKHGYNLWKWHRKLQIQ